MLKDSPIQVISHSNVENRFLIVAHNICCKRRDIVAIHMLPFYVKDPRLREGDDSKKEGNDVQNLKDPRLREGDESINSNKISQKNE